MKAVDGVLYVGGNKFVDVGLYQFFRFLQFLTIPELGGQA